MALDIESLDAFYRSSDGEVARRLLARRIRALWPDRPGSRVLGYGFAPPYLATIGLGAERVVAAMPAPQGVMAWAPGGRNLAVLILESTLPFADALFDRILVVHGLENCETERPFVRELWRVLAPEGRLLIVVPNRASLWAQFETSPFGFGRPYTRHQLATLLEESLFAPERWEAGLLIPPLRFRARTAAGWERVGRRLWPRLAGVHIVEASKSLYAFAGGRGQKGVRRPLFARAEYDRRDHGTLL